MAETNENDLPDLTGTVDERIAQLAQLDLASSAFPAEWLRRQLDAALAGWASDETELDIESESRVDF